MSVVYRTPRFEVVSELVGNKKHYYLKKNNAVLVIPIHKKKIGLVEIYRPATKKISWELPGGRVEDGDKPLDSAKKELNEETGLSFDSWVSFGVSYPLPSITNEKVFAFIARDVSNDSLKNICIQENEIDAFDFYSENEVKEKILNGMISSSIDAYVLLKYFLVEKP